MTGACLAYLGHRVTCVDTDEAKIAKLRRGEIAHLRTDLRGDAGTGGRRAAASISPPN